MTNTIFPTILRTTPNQGARPASVKAPTHIVIHGSAGRDQGDLDWIMRKEAQVSYHELIWRDGRVFNLVDPMRRAWHAGKSKWEGITDLNNVSLGIALSNLGPGKEDSFTDPQYEALIQRVRHYSHLYNIPLSNVLGHHMVSGPDARTDAKSDPWETFDWLRFFKGLVEIEARLTPQWIKIAEVAVAQRLAERAVAAQWWKKK
jgi:N-acetylmuramoyl-L-alanine amidase